MRTLVVIPAYNEAKVIGKVINSIKLTLPLVDILVIDDGSTDKTADVAEKSGTKVIKHRMNRGLGGAIGTGLEWAKRKGYDIAITFDADGQHDPQDINKAIKPIVERQADLVIGSRMSGMKDMPFDRRFINTIANLVTFLLFGITTSDSQSGFRAFGKKAIEGITIRTDRMEVSSEIFGDAQRLGLSVKEVPIKVIYTEYSRTKGQKNSNSFPILFRLILRLFR